MRLTFVGDIALDKPLLKAARSGNGKEFDFSRVFRTSDVFEDSDYVIGNLETVFGGGNRFNAKPYHYNSPDSFCHAVKAAGIDLVSTANNHCMDEGAAGVKRTNQLLDECGIEHTGTYTSDAEERFLIKEIHGLRIAFVSLTSHVNICVESLECENLFRYVNLLGFKGKRGSKLRNILRHQVMPGMVQKIRKYRKQATIVARTDSFEPGLIREAWKNALEKQLRLAREKSDFMVVLLHGGGQFNTEPGSLVKYLTDWLTEQGADIIIGNHPHTVQRVEATEKRIVAYSLGGFCMSPSGEYLVRDCLPEYSLVLHVDIDENSRSLRCTADIVKGTEDGCGYLTVAKATDSLAETIRRRSTI